MVQDRSDTHGGDLQVYNARGKIVGAVSVEESGSGWLGVYDAGGNQVAGMERKKETGGGNVWQK